MHDEMLVLKAECAISYEIRQMKKIMWIAWVVLVSVACGIITFYRERRYPSLETSYIEAIIVSAVTLVVGILGKR